VVERDRDKHSEVRVPVAMEVKRAEHIELAKVQGRHLKHREIPEEIRIEPERQERIDRAEQRERERQHYRHLKQKEEDK